MDRQQFLIGRLADGAFHSGEALASELGISRMAVWKRIKALAELELDIYSVNGKGHRLARPLETLESRKIRAQLSATTRAKLVDFEIVPVVDSTNLYLYRRLNESSIHATVVLAEFQSSGRGRRGNNWLSPYGSGLCLSLGWHFESTPDSLNALSLACGVAVCRSLRRLGIEGVGLKWPNDIVSQGKKLGGILLEARSETAGCSDVIIGIGVNVHLPDRTLTAIQQKVSDIERVSQREVSRNVLAGLLIDELFVVLEDYRRHGFNSCIGEWRAFDTLQGCQADIILHDHSETGQVLGIDEQGLLLMSVDGEVKRYSSGEVSVRAR